MGKTNRTRARKAHARGAGFTLLEMALAIMIVTISIGAISSSLLSSFSLARTNRERGAALDAAEGRIEAVRAADFEEAFARFNATAADDPGGTSPGSGFDVRGLTARGDDADGLAGEIVFPGDGTELREDVVDAELGMPRDLNLDGTIDALDHSGDYLVLPVRVRVEWTGAGGEKALEVVTTLTRR